jgi:hypothetical protein
VCGHGCRPNSALWSIAHCAKEAGRHTGQALDIIGDKA